MADRAVWVARAAERDFVLTPQALACLEELPEAEALAVLGKAFENAAGFVITHELIDEVKESVEGAEKARQIVVVQHTAYRPLAKDVEAQTKILEGDTEPQTGGAVADFVSYFKSRQSLIGSTLRGRMTSEAVVSAGKLKGFLKGRPARVIGMVAEKRETKNGHVMIELEDEDGVALCLVPKDSPVKKKARQVIRDEVIAVDGTASNELFIVKDIVWPEVPVREKKLVDDDISVAFVSDVHVGSRLFLKDAFEKFLRFLNGDGSAEQQKMAGKIKYLLLAGDLIDGIGVYPRQEKDLVTKDVYTQYEIFSEYLKNVPEHVEIVVAPGNHDAVRIAEPQPPLLPEFVKDLLAYKNIHFVGNPARASIHGLEAILYHGSSFFSMMSENPALAGSVEFPEKVGIEWLRRRHLSPTYGDNPVVPQKTDSLVIREIPDILHFGHVHHNGYADYRGTLIVNSGTWQDTTDYQIRQGMQPTPGQLPLYSMKTGNLNVLKFLNTDR